jgi:hypothetical protein
MYLSFITLDSSKTDLGFAEPAPKGFGVTDPGSGPGLGTAYFSIVL